MNLEDKELNKPFFPLLDLVTPGDPAGGVDEDEPADFCEINASSWSLYTKSLVSDGRTKLKLLLRLLLLEIVDDGGVGGGCCVVDCCTDDAEEERDRPINRSNFDVFSG